MFNEQAHAKKSGELDINQIANPSGQFNPALAAKKPFHEKSTGDIIDEVLKEADDADKNKEEAEKKKEAEEQEKERLSDP